MRRAGIKDFLNTYSKVLKFLLSLVMITIIAWVALTQLKKIEFNRLPEIAKILTWPNMLLLIMLGLIAFTGTGLYDLLVCTDFAIRPKKKLLIAWVAQAMNNFTGLGGVTGSALRRQLYIKNGISPDLATKRSVIIWMSNILGLLVIILLTFWKSLEFNSHWIKWIMLSASIYIPVFLWGERLPIGALKKVLAPLAFLPLRGKLRLLLSSCCEWVTAAAFFVVCVIAIQPGVNVFFVLAAYAFSTIMGVLSFMPGGLGGFDVTILSLFTAMNYDSSELLLSLLIFRLSYYLLPWILATIYTGTAGLRKSS